jgi:hypothetical protein
MPVHSLEARDLCEFYRCGNGEVSLLIIFFAASIGGPSINISTLFPSSIPQIVDCLSGNDVTVFRVRLVPLGSR